MIFRVKNSKKYDEPKYPSHNEPDMIEIERYRYPFTRYLKFVPLALLSAGALVAYYGFQKNEPQLVLGDIVEIPPIQENAVRPVIKQILENAGLKLKEDIAFKNNNAEFEIDFYDENRKIGFEFVSGNERDYNFKNNQDPNKISYDEITIMQKNERKSPPYVMVIDSEDYNYRPKGMDAQSQQKALKKMEDAVRDYVKWLKDQGAL